MKKFGMQVVMAAILAFAVGCGSESTDRPQDCRDDEYFDEGRKQCRSCPAVLEPVCRPGCEAEVVLDQRECPQLRCGALCEGCGAEEEWDEESESCRPLSEEI